ncbi:MAG TPA: DUF1549 domain-containing protein, partial [Planctomycetaceae bacterium]|nr:DUF1549 domain-containing protein [Planctomycetaceae bacterium]
MLPKTMLRLGFCLVLLTPIVCGAETDSAQESEGREFFEAKIRPVLVEHCYRCHSAASGKSEGNLQLDARSTIRKGGDRGPAVVPGKPEESLLLTAMTHADTDLKMPPKKDRLPDSVIQDFRSWIVKGAADPRDKATPGALPPVSLEAGREFWAFQKPVAHAPPRSSKPEWAKRDLDHFILAQLDSAGLTPAPDAAPQTVLRRVYFDLIGLPPSPETLEQFLKSVSQDGLDLALATEVDKLLTSTQFGERWGRHWLDVARFAESSGKEANVSFPYAFRYRDYV